MGIWVYNAPMKITEVKTSKITDQNHDILEVLDAYLPRLQEGTVVAVTSKIVSICEGRMVPFRSKEEKDEIIKKEADYYLPSEINKYHVWLTIKNSIIIFSSGVDESNGNGYLVLWPSDPQKWANTIREHLAKKHSLQKIGVIITDTSSMPLRRGQKGIVLAHSGFYALNDYVGKPDIFGRVLKITKAAVADALATASVLVMGEGNEQTPLALVEDIPFVQFQGRNPTQEELAELRIAIEDDLFGEMVSGVRWEKGGI
ncbi:MAG: coenzyme F420-0:L-glutamate ligase [Candidatus Wildermuthbacteria bacterium]|nr:coenzyme F420-0:L-glutamate ligase [Candidatus Wildermuthbacteria bacterium]